MFGYVRASSAELKVKEYELYRGVYCGLCRSMGKCTGQCSRMTLSYDFAYLALLRTCLEGQALSFRARRCIAHPLRKRNMAERNAVLEYCAHAAAILNYHKIKDDVSDERGAKKLRALAVLPLVAHARRRALKAGYAELDSRIGELLRVLAQTEAKALVSVDAPAAVFGDILALICSHGLDGAQARIASAVGHSVGKWIYVVDALDDIAEDGKKGRYNPFLLLYGGRMPTSEELFGIADALKAELVCAADALDLMETEMIEIRNIIDNIMYLGLPGVVDGVLGKDKRKKSKKGNSPDEQGSV